MNKKRTFNEKNQCYRILVVDDEADIRFTTSKRLEAHGYTIETACDGSDAIEKVETFKPHLILLDVMMNNMNGYECCKKLNSRLNSTPIPVIFVTALNQIKDKIKSFSLGAVDHISKPFESQTLLNKVKSHIHTFDHWVHLEELQATRSSSNSFNLFDEFKDFLSKDSTLPEELLKDDKVFKRDNIYAHSTACGVSQEVIANNIASFLKIKYIPHVRLDSILLGVLPINFCIKNNVITIKDEHSPSTIIYLLDNPFNWEVMDILKNTQKDGKEVEFAITTPKNINVLFNQELGRIHQSKKVDDQDEKKQTEQNNIELIEKIDDIELKIQSNMDQSQDKSSKQIVDDIISKAVGYRASDIHIEPRRNALVVRFRIDGVLLEHIKLNKEHQSSIISRLKVMSNLNIAEHRVPQDGRISISYDSRKIDLRVSIMPLYLGEKVVVRILDQSRVMIDISSLCLNMKQLSLFKENMQKSTGLILVTGPTGSGKSTTLYTALDEINRIGINITTVEDPIEYEQYRVNQVQVNSQAGRTFPIVLRSILRQDPDVIMIGELRDKETLDISFKSALTGHLVLSTLHTNDSISSITRLLDMGIEPYIVATSLELIIAQRLVRRLCIYCKKVQDVTGHDNLPEGTYYKAVGCEHCNGTGYQNRMPIIEMLPINDTMKKLIANNEKLDIIRTYAKEELKMTTLIEDGLSKASQGHTTLDEIYRVT